MIDVAPFADMINLTMMMQYVRKYGENHKKKPWMISVVVTILIKFRYHQGDRKKPNANGLTN